MYRPGVSREQKNYMLTGTPTTTDTRDLSVDHPSRLSLVPPWAVAAAPRLVFVRTITSRLPQLAVLAATLIQLLALRALARPLSLSGVASIR